MSFVDWASQIVQDLEKGDVVEFPISEERWQEWATRLCWIPRFAKTNPPNPGLFPDWRSWAENFVLGVE